MPTLSELMTTRGLALYTWQHRDVYVTTKGDVLDTSIKSRVEAWDNVTELMYGGREMASRPDGSYESAWHSCGPYEERIIVEKDKESSMSHSELPYVVECHNGRFWEAIAAFDSERVALAYTAECEKDCARFGFEYRVRSLPSTSPVPSTASKAVERSMVEKAARMREALERLAGKYRAENNIIAQAKVLESIDMLGSAPESLARLFDIIRPEQSS